MTVIFSISTIIMIKTTNDTKKDLCNRTIIIFIDWDVSNFKLCLYLIEISASQECLIVFMDHFVLVLNMKRRMNKGSKQGRVYFLKKIQNYFYSKAFQGFSFSMKGFPQIIFTISNYILKIISQVF